MEVVAGLVDPKVCRKLVAPTHAALLRADLSSRHRLLAGEIVSASLAKGRQFARVIDARQLGALRQFSFSDVADILNGRKVNGVWVPGLVELKIVWKKDLPDDKGWVVVMNPNHSRWEVKWLHTEKQRLTHLALLDEQARILERQLVSGAVFEWFPDVRAMLHNGDLEDAVKLLAPVDGGSQQTDAHERTTDDGLATPMASRPRPVVRRADSERAQADGRAAVTGSDAVDAHDVPPLRPERSCAAHDSVLPNRKPPEIGGDSILPNRRFGNIESTRARTVNGEQKQITVQQLNCYGDKDESNRLLADLRIEFARAHGNEAADAEMQRSGGNWRRVARAMPQRLEREIAALRAHINEGGHFTKNAWFWLRYYLVTARGFKDWDEAIKKSGNPTFSIDKTR